MSATSIQTDTQLQTVSRRLAPEDIQVGNFVTILQQVLELPTFLWLGETAAVDRERPVAYRHTPANSGEPLKVLAVCLPFVYVENTSGEPATLEVRRSELAELPASYVEVIRRKRKKIIAKAARKTAGRTKKLKRRAR